MRNENEDNIVSVSSKKKRILYEQFLKRSEFEKKLLLTIMVVFVLSTTLILLIFCKKQAPVVCTTKSCIFSAARLAKSMNMLMDPCSDFYEYACGNYKALKFYPYEKYSNWFTAQELKDDLLVKKMIENENSLDNQTAQKLKLFYKMCMDTDRLNELGLDPLFNLLDILELPHFLPTNMLAKNFNIARTLALIQRNMNHDLLIEISVHHNDTLNSNFLMISPNMNTFPILERQEKLRNEEWKNQYKKSSWIQQLTYMVSIMSELDTTELYSMEDLINEVFNMLMLHSQLNEDIINVSQDTVFRYMSIAELQEYMFSKLKTSNFSEVLFDWQEYISILIKGTDISVTKDLVIYIEHPIYFQILAERLTEFGIGIFQKIIWWNVVDRVLLFTSERMRLYMIHVEGAELSSTYDRSIDCIHAVKYYFDDFIAHELASSSGFSSIEENINTIVSDIKRATIKLLSDNVWISRNAKHWSIKKINDVKVIIGFSKKLMNSSQKVNFYEKIKIVPDELLKTITYIANECYNYLIIGSLNEQSVLHGEEDSRFFDVFDGPLTVNSYYNLEKNVLVLPISLLQFSFYGDDIQVLNYGAIGTIIGQEFVHSFQNQLLGMFGEKAVKSNIEVMEEYHVKVNCLYHLYKNVSISDDSYVNEVELFLQHVDDIGGIKAAHLAYQKRFGKYESNLVLPGFEELSPEQLFFLSYTNMWCEKVNNFEYTSDLNVEYPQHSRILTALENSPEFSKAWQCSLFSSMNPPMKCSFW